jgi:predicted dehydrogenase
VRRFVKRLRTAIIGTGFMGRVHLEALRRVEGVDVAAIASRDLASARKLGVGFGVEGAFDDYGQLLNDSTIDAVHICTPNATHHPIAKQALLASKHVLCEKPLATSVADAQELVSLAAEKGLRNCVCHNLRYYPMVQQMRRMVQEGSLGRILVVQGTYSQDWLLYDTDWNWRADAELGGSLRAMADIGSHWFDMAEHVTGLRVESLCADLQTVHPIRKRPKGNVETFAGKLAKAQDVDEVRVDTDDFGAVIFRMGESTRGSMTASQVSAGRKNRLSIEVYGTESGAAWDQERPDELWLGNRNSPNGIIIKDPTLMKDSARGYADLPGGHSEGYDDTFKQVFRRFYGSISDTKASIEYPTLSDGLRQMQLLEAVRTSHEKRSWRQIGG